MALVENDDQVFAATRYIPPQTLSPDRHVDDETVRTAAIAHISPVLLALVVDDDSIPAAAATQVWGFQPAFYNPNDDAAFSPTVTTGSITVSAPLVTSPEIFYTTFVTLVGLGGGPLQKLKPPPKHQDNDVIYAFTSSRMSGLVTDLDVIRAPIVCGVCYCADGVGRRRRMSSQRRKSSPRTRCGLRWCQSDDASYDALFSMVLQPALFASDDEIPAADVGWKVIAEITTDVDEIYSVDAYAFYPLYPDVWMDEEHVDTYPFFVQSARRWHSGAAARGRAEGQHQEGAAAEGQHRDAQGSMTEINQNFSLFVHNDMDVYFDIGPDDTGTNLDFAEELTWKAYSQILGVPSGEPLITKAPGAGITIDDPLLMQFTIALLSADTNGLAGNYYHEVMLVANHGKVTTLATGLMTVIDPTVVPNVDAFKAHVPGVRGRRRHHGPDRARSGRAVRGRLVGRVADGRADVSRSSLHGAGRRRPPRRAWRG